MSRLQLSWVKSELSLKQRMLAKEAVEGAFCLGYALNCGLAADKQQLELMEMNRWVEHCHRYGYGYGNGLPIALPEKGGKGKHNVKCYSKFAEFIYANEVAFMTPPSQHAHKRQCQAQAGEKDRWERGVERGREREWGREKGKEKKPSNEWNLSRLFSSFCATIKQFTYIFEYSNILLTNYAEGIIERKSGKREGEGVLPMGSGCCPSSFALMNLKPFCLRVMWEMNT